MHAFGLVEADRFNTFQEHSSSERVETKPRVEEATNPPLTGPFVPSTRQVNMLLAQQNSDAATKVNVEEVVLPRVNVPFVPVSRKPGVLLAKQNSDVPAKVGVEEMGRTSMGLSTFESVAEHEPTLVPIPLRPLPRRPPSSDLGKLRFQAAGSLSSQALPRRKLPVHAAGISPPEDLPLDTFAAAAMHGMRHRRTKALSAFAFEYDGFQQVSASRENFDECTERVDKIDDETQSTCPTETTLTTSASIYCTTSQFSSEGTDTIITRL